jgi:hypothetical protein
MFNDKSIYEFSTADLEKKDNTGISLPSHISKVLANKNLGVVITSTNPSDSDADKVSNGSVVLWS